ncbi:hypothetical protein VUJ46_19085 [Chryseobacterium sp. MYb264]|uniref:hypothetical protein n=1 Tax=Chryseobacterium sp. MYb264 TaxID=2745153 RepID=UPI002E0EC383|nr:hypothetical protein VUJ46_19085 [Chryseobacterium sp. MYb264]
MGNILRGIDGERFPLIGKQAQKYSVTFDESVDIGTINDDEILWQIYAANEYDKYEKVPFSGQKKGKLTTYTFLQKLLNKNLQLQATYKNETVELHITPQANGEIKIIDVFFMDVEYKIREKDNLKYMNSVNLQIYTLNMLGKYVDFKIFGTLNGIEKELYKSDQPLKIEQKNGIIKTKKSILLSPAMYIQTQQDLSASVHSYRIKVWETDNESNFYEEGLTVKNEMGKMEVPQDSQTPVKTGTSEPVKNKEEKKYTCGIEYRNSITCVKYGSKNPIYGPLYYGSIKLGFYKNWENIISEGKVDQEQKEIILAMSENEGNMDAVQSYDSEILTAGAMQKTINPDGYGELSIQLWEFKQEYPEKFKMLFENCGWSVKEIEIKDHSKTIKKYQSFYNEKTGKELKSLIRKGFEEKKYKQKVICIPVEPFINACKDEDFQAKQIIDFIKRLNNAINKTPNGYSSKIKDFVKSKLGKATVLDHDVNRPGHVSNCFGEALNKFFAEHNKLSRNPADWGENHHIYEKEILKIYGPLRGQGKYTMTDANARYIKLKSRL